MGFFKGFLTSLGILPATPSTPERSQPLHTLTQPFTPPDPFHGVDPKRIRAYVVPDEDGLVSYTTIGINYRDLHGRQTMRVITIHEIVTDDDAVTTLSAYCHLRHDLRNFRVDRIYGLFNPETGEVLTGVKLVARNQR